MEGQMVRFAESEPIGLKREQFGMVAAIAILASMIPTLVSIAPPLHIVKINIGKAAQQVGRAPVLIEIFENGAVTVSGKPVTLLQVSKAAAKAKLIGRGVLLKPDACAPHAIVVETVAALARTGNPKLAIAQPDFPTTFDKSWRSGAGRDNYREFVLSPANLATENANRWRSSLAHSVAVFDDGCQRKAYPERNYRPPA
jgi:biopolymer transport protein ExbD